MRPHFFAVKTRAVFLLMKAQSSKDKVDVLSQAFIISGQASAESLNRPFMNSVRMELFFFFKEYLITSRNLSHQNILWSSPNKFPKWGMSGKSKLAKMEGSGSLTPRPLALAPCFVNNDDVAAESTYTSGHACQEVRI